MGGIDTGTYCIARPIDRENNSVKGEDPYYKIRATILTGQFSEQNCYVSYRGETPPLRDNCIIRIASWQQDLTDLFFNFDEITSHFISLEIPKDFDAFPSRSVFLYAEWNDNVPKLSEIRQIYDPGFMFRALHIGNCFFNLFRDEDPEPLSSQIETQSAIKWYLDRVNRYASSKPRLATIDSKANDINEIVQILLSFKEIKSVIRMQPQT